MKSFFLLTVVAMAVGCVGSGQMNTVKKRAPFDLECSEEKLKVAELSDNTFGVEGCDRRATYICTHEYPLTCAANTIDGAIPK